MKIESLIKVMKEMIKNAISVQRAENATKAYCDLLDQMEYMHESDEIYRYYCNIHE